jgi:hypothetical protein
MMNCLCWIVEVSGKTTKALFRSRANASMMRSTSSVFWKGDGCSCNANDGAAASIDRTNKAKGIVFGLKRIATRSVDGERSLSS